jgi:streptogramin lyase
VTVAPDGDLWFTENFSNKIGRMAPDGKVIGEYTIPVGLRKQSVGVKT